MSVDRSNMLSMTAVTAVTCPSVCEVNRRGDDFALVERLNDVVDLVPASLTVDDGKLFVLSCCLTNEVVFGAITSHSFDRVVVESVGMDLACRRANLGQLAFLSRKWCVWYCEIVPSIICGC